MNPNNSSDYIWDFLTDPKNLELALTLEDYVPRLRLYVFERFWSNVQKLLEQKRNEYGKADCWRTFMPNDIEPYEAFLGFVDKTDPGVNNIADPKPRRYAVGIGCLVNDKEEPFITIVRGTEVDGLSPREDGLLSDLKRMDFEFGTGKQSYYCGWRYIKTAELPFIRKNDMHTAKKLNEDNRNPDRPFAHGVAEELWNLFVRFHQRLEDLNENYPYS